MKTNRLRLILASTSSYRRELLGRLHIPFEAVAPDTDEQAGSDENARALATRLAAAKAAEVARHHPDALVIGSDQTLSMVDDDGRELIFGKSGSMTAARAQLRQLAGREATFHTAVCARRGERRWHHVDRTVVTFRNLSDDEIARYVERDEPVDCAGSFKCERLGIALFERIESHDPTALIGLPLIAVAAMLREAGFAAP